MQEILDPSSGGKPASAPPSCGRVYFAQAGEHGPIKIGWTRGDPNDRIASLQTGNPYRITLLIAVPGSGDDERDIHIRFDRIRMVGEWFQPTAELVAFIDAIRWTRKAGQSASEGRDEAPAPDDDAIPAPPLPCAVCEGKRSMAARRRAWETTFLRRAWRAVEGGPYHDGIRGYPKLQEAASYALADLGQGRGGCDSQLGHELAGLIRTLWEAP